MEVRTGLSEQKAERISRVATDSMAAPFKLLEDADFEHLVGLICDETEGWEQANDGEVKGERRSCCEGGENG